VNWKISLNYKNLISSDDEKFLNYCDIIDLYDATTLEKVNLKNF